MMQGATVMRHQELSGALRTTRLVVGLGIPPRLIQRSIHLEQE